jgi:hypothetical protein
MFGNSIAGWAKSQEYSLSSSYMAHKRRSGAKSYLKLNPSIIEYLPSLCLSKTKSSQECAVSFLCWENTWVCFHMKLWFPHLGHHTVHQHWLDIGSDWRISCWDWVLQCLLEEALPPASWILWSERWWDLNGIKQNCVIPCIWNVHNKWIQRDKKDIRDHQGLGRREDEED